jgi:hypothetical protein
MASSARTIRSSERYSEGVAERFRLDIGDFREAALAARGLDLRGFFDIFAVPDNAPISGLLGGRKPLK